VDVPEAPLYLVFFEETAAPRAAAGGPCRPAGRRADDRGGRDPRIARSRNCGPRTNTSRAANEELETANEELKSSNEEMQSVNEELQSANEELETSKEELQSVNEELATVNAELNRQGRRSVAANNDMNNLLPAPASPRSLSTITCASCASRRAATRSST
jgi:two-component system CheB/CheR fusion protein